MSDAFWSGLFILLGTCATLLATYIQGRKTRAKTDVVITKTDQVLEGNHVIHKLVNSKMSSALAEIERLKGIVEALQRGEVVP